MAPRQTNPFIVGDWIKQDKDFIGREALIQYFLSLQRQRNWLIGSRRMGKTSLLRYLQRRFRDMTQTLSVFWDVSAIRTAADALSNLQDSVESIIPDLKARNIAFNPDQPQPDVFTLMRALARACSERQVTLVLLIDEAEALFGLLAREQDVLHKMKAVLDNEPIHIIMASNHGLETYDPLNTEHLLSPFLQGFAPPQFLQAWSREEALVLIARCTLITAEQDQIITVTGGLPFLVQMVCFYYHEQNSLDAAIENIKDRHLLDLFFRHDLHGLGETNSRMLAYLGQQQPVAPAVFQNIHHAEPSWLQRLTLLHQLGFIRIEDNGIIRISNDFLSDWLQIAFPCAAATNCGAPAKMLHRLWLCLNRDAIRVDWNDQTIYIGRLVRSKTTALQSDDAGHQLYQDIFSIPDLLPVKERLSTEHDMFQIYLENVHGECPPIEWLHDGRDFLAFRHSITRVKEGLSPAPDRQTIASPRILLIAADTPPLISRVDQEIILIREQIQTMAREKNVKMPVDCLFSHQSDIDTVMNTLASGRYDVVHYAGHAIAAEGFTDHKLYFNQRGATRQAVKAIWASDWLQQAAASIHFLYINGCGESNRLSLPSRYPDHVRFLLCNRTKVMDESSAQFAVELYRLLIETDFDPPCAMSCARKQWYERYAQDPAVRNYWLWPVLYRLQ